MKTTVTAMALILGAAEAPAATWTYDYQGRELVCPEDECFEGSYPKPGFAGRVAIDEGLLPGGTLADASIAIEMTGTGGSREYLYTTTVRSGGETFVERRSDRASDDVLPDFVVELTGIWDYLLGYTVDANIVTWSFGADRGIVSWFGTDMCGGSCDAFTGPDGDGFMDGTVSVGPGAWTVTPPAPIPLPASAPLLVLGVAALGAAGAITRRRSAG